MTICGLVYWEDRQGKAGCCVWSARKSLVLSKVCTVVFMALLVVVLLNGPKLVLWLTGFSTSAMRADANLFLVTLYSGGAIGAALLVVLYMLLHNIGKGQVFVQRNVRYLRMISWCCFIGAAVAFASTFYYLPWGIVAIAAAFVGLVVRVVKNVIAEAILLKEENDYTI